MKGKSQEGNLRASRSVEVQQSEKGIRGEKAVLMVGAESGNDS